MIETRTSVYDFHFHLVFVTKYRKSIFDTTEKQEELKTLLVSFAEKNGSTIESAEVMPDHVHLVLSFPPKFAPSSIVKKFQRCGCSGMVQTSSRRQSKTIQRSSLESKFLHADSRSRFARDGNGIR